MPWLRPIATVRYLMVTICFTAKVTHSSLYAKQPTTMSADTITSLFSRDGGREGGEPGKAVYLLAAIQIFVVWRLSLIHI